jgi:hypothetical protein
VDRLGTGHCQMHRLARILILEKWRTTLARNGRTGAASLSLLLAAFGCIAGLAAGRLAGTTTGQWHPAVLNGVWLSWVLVGVLVGKDLSWNVGLERLRTFPVAGFPRLYALGLVLSFVSYPLLVAMASIAVARASGTGAGLTCWPGFAIGIVLLVVSVRSVSSLARVSIHFAGGLEFRARIVLWGSISAIAAWIAAGVHDPDFQGLLPGGLFAVIIAPKSGVWPVCRLAAVDLLLVAADISAQKAVVHSGASGPAAGRHLIRAGGRLLTIHPGWPSVLWRTSLLGWLRNRNALMLLLWGMLYGSVYLYLTRPDSAFDYIVFSWMVTVFHSYLRGNLLGVDHCAVWVYYTFPAPVESVLVAKNRTLSILQGCMLAAVLFPALLRPVPGMDTGAWISIVLGAYSTVLVGEIVGSYFSVKFPEPIDRGSQFSGGMSAGSLAIPVLQAVFFVTFLVWAGLARRGGNPSSFWLGAIAVPVILSQTKSILVRGWVRRKVDTGHPLILTRLSGIPS